MLFCAYLNYSNLEGLLLCDESELYGRPILRQNHMRYRLQAERPDHSQYFMQHLPCDPKKAP